MLLRNEYLSLDPYMRRRMSDAPSYAAPVEIGAVISDHRGFAGLLHARSTFVIGLANTSRSCRRGGSHDMDRLDALSGCEVSGRPGSGWWWSIGGGVMRPRLGWGSCRSGCRRGLRTKLGNFETKFGGNIGRAASRFDT